MSEIDPEKLEEALTTLEASSCGRLAEIVFAAARAHLATLPRVKEVEVWRVEYAWTHAGHHNPVIAQYTTHEMARNHAENLGDAASCISVTGPHKQRVPS